jgi:sensor histidine kinase YesM
MTLPDPTSGSTPRPTARRSTYIVRGLLSAGFGLGIGAPLALLREQNLWDTLFYSLSIALICWFCIDTGRLAAARWQHRSSNCTGTKPGNGWPGWPLMAAIVVIGSAIGVTAGTALGDRLTGNRSASLFGASSWRELLTQLLFGLIPAIAFTYFYYSRGQLADREALAQTAQRLAAENQLKLLESQLEPHMLFNTLANLRVLIGLDPPRAQAMLDHLIAFLRATLSGSQIRQQSLRAEFARLADYLALVQVRMADRLTAHFELPDVLADITVPPLLLQPLVENSIKHGLETAVHGGRIDVSAGREGGELVLRVRDTGFGIGAHVEPGDTAKFGLRQVRERLATLYGKDASLTLSSATDAEGGTLAVIRLPLPAQ